MLAALTTFAQRSISRFRNSAVCGRPIGAAGSAPSLESGMVIVMLINFGMLFFGQVFFDFSGVPFLRPFVRAVPLSYLSDLLRQIMSGIEGLSPIWIDVLALVGWTIAGVTIAIWRFQFDMEER